MERCCQKRGDHNGSNFSQAFHGRLLTSLENWLQLINGSRQNKRD
jgi:hypothetical protein